MLETSTCILFCLSSMFSMFSQMHPVISAKPDLSSASAFSLDQSKICYRVKSFIFSIIVHQPVF